MIVKKTEQYFERLYQRRVEILRTLDYLNQEQRTLVENKHSIDKAAYESRRHLLERLAEWYASETTRIDHALIRMREAAYGTCIGCRRPIELHRLQTAPETTFCAECQCRREKSQGSGRRTTPAKCPGLR